MLSRNLFNRLYLIPAGSICVKISTDVLQSLSYSYQYFSRREAMYNKIIEKYFGGIREPSSLIRSVFSRQKKKLQEKGFVDLTSIDLLVVDRIKAIVLDNLLPSTKANYKFYVDQNILLSTPEILQLFTSFNLVRPIQLYLGVLPSLHSINAWQTEGSHDLERTPEMHWHMDHHGHKFVKVFYYLTDTNLGYGHHDFLLSSHYQPAFDKLLDSTPTLEALRFSIQKKRIELRNYRINDDCVLPLSESVLSVAGKAGTGFMEDTRGLHRGTVLPPNHKRVIIQGLYVPFNSGKDPIYSPSIENDTLVQIKQANEYSDLEMIKLFQLLTPRAA